MTGEPLSLQVCGEAHSATETVQKKIIAFFFFLTVHGMEVSAIP